MERNTAGAVYGTITVGALLAAERAAHETYLETIAAVLAAIVLYGLAHAYATYTAQRLRERRRLSFAGLLAAAEHELPLLGGAAIPLLTVILFGLGGASLGTAVTAATWMAAVVVFAIELIAGLRARLKGRELIAHVALGAGLGCLVIAVRILLH
jgi:hypothetical protein